MYNATVNKTGTKYLGLTLEWDYQKRTVKGSMPEYVAKVLHRL